MAIVYSYLRFSSKRQQYGDSFRRQREMGLAWIKANGHKEATLLLDKGVSSFRGENKHKGALSKFLGMIKAEKIPTGSILLIENLDRLSRQGADEAFDLFRKILASGVDIVCLKPEPKQYTKADLKDFFSLLMPLVYFHLAYIESKNKSDRTGAFWANIRKTGKVATTRRPAWIDWDKKTKLFKLNGGAEAIRFIFEETVAGKGQKQILKGLQESFRPIGSSGRWNSSYISKVLQDRAVHGEMQFHKFDEEGNRIPTGEIVKDYYPAVVTEELWNAAYHSRKKRLKQKGPNQGYVNLFRGLIHNANDREAMHHKRSPMQGGGVQRRLVSYKHGRKEAGADSVSVDLCKFEAMFLRYLYEVDATDLLPKSGIVEKELRQKRLSLSGIASRIGDIEAALADASSTSSVSSLAVALDDLSEQRKHTEREILELENQSQNAIYDAKHIVELLEDKEGEELQELRLQLRHLLHDVVEVIWIKPEKHFSHVYWLAQVFFKNGHLRWLWGGWDIRAQGVSFTQEHPGMVELEIDLRDLRSAKGNKPWAEADLFGPLLSDPSSRGQDYMPPESIPNGYKPASEVFLNVCRSKQSRESAKVIPAQMGRLEEYLTKRGTTDKSDIESNIKKLWSGWTRHLNRKVKKGELALATARTTYRRGCQFLKFWGIDHDYRSASAAITNGKEPS